MTGSRNQSSTARLGKRSHLESGVAFIRLSRSPIEARTCSTRLPEAHEKCGDALDQHRRCPECVKPICKFLDCPCEMKKALGAMPNVLEWAPKCKECGIPIARRDKNKKWRPYPSGQPCKCPWCGANRFEG